MKENNDFEKLLEELKEVQSMTKSLNAVDPDAEQSNQEGAQEGAQEGGQETVLKSFIAKDEEGKEFEAIDATDMLKSLQAKVSDLESKTGNEELAKSINALVGAMTSQTEILKDQSLLIKSLQDEINVLKGAPAGRKSVVNIAEKPVQTFAKSQSQEGISGQEFMAKCMAAQQAGILTSREVSTVELSLQKGLEVPQHIISKVAGADKA